MEYSDNVKRQALNLYLDHTPISAIAEMPEMPSRATIYNYKSDGVLTDGVDWSDYRDEVESNSLRRAAEGDSGAFWERFESTAREALISAVERIRDGQTSVRGSDLNQIASALLKRDQLDTREDSRVDREDAVRGFLRVLRSRVDEAQYLDLFDGMKQDLADYYAGEKTLGELQAEAAERGVVGVSH